MSFIDPELYRMVVIAAGLRLYARTGLKPNRAYTPTAMLKAATTITGANYKRGQYLLAADDIDKKLEELKNAN